MSSITTTQQKEIAEFFDKEIDAQAFARKMRKLLYVSLMQNLVATEQQDNETLAESCFWLTNFLELIDPTGILE